MDKALFMAGYSDGTAMLIHLPPSEESTEFVSVCLFGQSLALLAAHSIFTSTNYHRLPRRLPGSVHPGTLYKAGWERRGSVSKSLKIRWRVLTLIFPRSRGLYRNDISPRLSDPAILYELVREPLQELARNSLRREWRVWRSDGA